MRTFSVIIRTNGRTISYSALAHSSSDAWFSAAASQGSIVCAITVLPAGNK